MFNRRPLWSWAIPVILLLLSNSALLGAETVVYKKIGNQELKLFIEKPGGWKAEDKRPAVVFFFGGSWVGGTPEQFLKESEYLAQRGVVGLRVVYRTVSKEDNSPPTICCADAKSALRYVRSHAAMLGIDPARIAAAGGSAGGHLAAFTALVPGLDDAQDDLSVSCRPDALILFNPVFNNGPGQWGYKRVGEKFLEYSPAHHVTNGAPPTIVFIGDADKLIPLSVVTDFEDKMKKAGADCRVHVYPGVGHGFFNKEPYLGRALGETEKFLTSLGWISSAPISHPTTVPQ